MDLGVELRQGGSRTRASARARRGANVRRAAAGVPALRRAGRGLGVGPGDALRSLGDQAVGWLAGARGAEPTVSDVPTFDVCGALPEGVTVLEASAGTGKTYTIAALAARYVAEGTPLERLLLLTFT